MSYTIQYSPESNERYPIPQHRKKNNWLLFACMLLFAFAIGWFGMQNRETVKEFLIPGDSAHTEAAFNMMVSDIRDGSGIGDAITTFCLEIMEYAEQQA